MQSTRALVLVIVGVTVEIESNGLAFIEKT